MPDLIDVLLDGAVGCELAAAGHVQDRHLRPARLITVCLLDAVLRRRVGLEVCEDEIRIRAVAAVRVQERIIDVAEHFRLAGILAVDQLHQHAADILVVVEVVGRTVAALVLSENR